MLPYGHAADALLLGYLVVAVPFGKTEAEDALLLLREVADHELDDVGEAVVIALRLIQAWLNLQVAHYGLMAQALQAPVADTDEKVMLFGLGQEHDIAPQQSLEDVTDYIFTLLLIVQEGARHSLHLGVIL